jgi:hypothetical protein
MVSRGENHSAIAIEIVILRKKSRAASASQPIDFSQNGVRIAEGAGNSGDRLETGTAEACRLDPLRCKAMKNVSRHDNLVAPAKSLVEMPLRDAALVVLSA